MLRPATKKDLEDLYEIFMDESVNPSLSLDFMSLSLFRKEFDNILADGSLMVYETNGVVMGTCKISNYRHKQSHVACLEYTAIKPSYQGNGIGTAMLEGILQELKDEGIKRVELHVAELSGSSIEFFKKFGFTVEGKLKKYFARSNQDEYADSVLMAKIFE